MPATISTSRRTLLGGLGVSMALPWLKSLPFASAVEAKATGQPPTRTLVTFTGMGFHSDHWWARGEGDTSADVDKARAFDARVAVGVMRLHALSADPLLG